MSKPTALPCRPEQCVATPRKVYIVRTRLEITARSDQRSIRPRALAFSWSFGVPPVTAVAVKTVYLSRRDLVDAS